MVRRLLTGTLLLGAGCQPPPAAAVASAEPRCPKVETTPTLATGEETADHAFVAAGSSVERGDEPEHGETPAESDRPWEAPKIEIEAFDCASSWEHKEGQLLRSNAGGGPSGAAWNWYGGALVCTVRVASNCRADAQVTVRVGRDYESAIAVAVGPLEGDTPTATGVNFEIGAPHWERELRASRSSVYETLLLVTHVSAHCPGPVGVTPEMIDITDSFVGRFSGGE